MLAHPGLRDDEAYSPVQATRRIPQQRENAFPKIQAIRWSVDHESTDVAAVGIDIHIAAPFVPVVDHPEIGFSNRGMRSEGGLDQGKREGGVFAVFKATQRDVETHLAPPTFEIAPFFNGLSAPATIASVADSGGR
jgi:hypothetical protein